MLAGMDERLLEQRDEFREQIGIRRTAEPDTHARTSPSMSTAAGGLPAAPIPVPGRRLVPRHRGRPVVEDHEDEPRHAWTTASIKGGIPA